jgi:hypothetical protein
MVLHTSLCVVYCMGLQRSLRCEFGTCKGEENTSTRLSPSGLDVTAQRMPTMLGRYQFYATFYSHIVHVPKSICLRGTYTNYKQNTLAAILLQRRTTT